MTDNIHVTHIVSGDLWAGAEVQAYQLGKALKNHTNITPHFILFNEGLLAKELRTAGIDTCIFEERELSPISIISHVRKQLIKQQTQVLHTHGYKENIIGNLARLSSPVKYSVRTEHGSAENHYSWKQWPQKVIHSLDKFIGRNYQQKIIAVSKHLERELTPIYGSDKIVQIYNAIDTYALKKLSTNNAQIKSTSAPIKIAFAARLVPVKRVDIFIAAMNELKQSSNHEFEAHIFGDGPLLNNTQKIAKASSNPDLFHFHGFTSPLPPQLAAMDTLVICSDHEGLPMTLLEALSMGVVPVCHSVGGMKEILTNDNDGLLIEPHTSQAFSKAIAELISNPEHLLELRENAMNTAQTNFEMSKVVNEYKRLYISTLSNAK